MNTKVQIYMNAELYWKNAEVELVDYIYNVSCWSMASKVLKATGLTRLKRELSKRGDGNVVLNTYYPSTPASKARRLSSRDDMPVKANILERVGSSEKISGFWAYNVLRAVSISRISKVAEMPMFRLYEKYIRLRLL